ncbi:MAG: DUF58 domain-containing protein [Polyangiaceae bacterium]|nr:DUF58 domain-containing protein [Polyangiaceae bacterium]
MRVYSTQATFHLALASLAMVCLGVVTQTPEAVVFGGSMLLVVGAERLWSRMSARELRRSGFEMIWLAPRKVLRTTRGGIVEVKAELRNKSGVDLRAIDIRAVASSMLEATTHPATLDVPAWSSTEVTVSIRAKRVGRWGLHGLALEVRPTHLSGEAPYEAPLMFASPFGIEVFPKSPPLSPIRHLGGRSRKGVETGRPARFAGEGENLRELRELVPGDPFKRIAWRASARRGKLLVRELERNERDVVWLVVDASVDLWSGAPGEAPLDRTLDEVYALAEKLLRRGDRVGLVVTASRLRSWIPPDQGLAHAGSIAAALASAAGTVDEDRSDLDEQEVAYRVYEHARPLDSRAIADVKPRELDLLAIRVAPLRSRAPFSPRLPFARTARDQTFRHYLASFGIELPPRAEGEYDRAHHAMVGIVERILREKHKPSQVHIFSSPPSPGAPIFAMLRRLRNKKIGVSWTLPAEMTVPTATARAEVREVEIAVPTPGETSLSAVVRTLITMRTKHSKLRAERMLRSMGVRSRSRF